MPHEQDLLDLHKILDEKTYTHDGSKKLKRYDVYKLDDIIDEVDYLQAKYNKLLHSKTATKKEIDEFKERLDSVNILLEESLKDIEDEIDE